MSVKSDETAIIKNILQTEKQMFCSICMKFMCSIHFYENNRTHYSPWTSCNYKAFMASYRRFLTINYNTFKSNLELLEIVINKIDKLNEYISGKKGSKTFGKVHKIDMENLKILVSQDKYLQTPCENLCYTSIASAAELAKINGEWGGSTLEYIQKLLDIYKFQPCKISSFLKTVLLQGKTDIISCKEVNNYITFNNRSFNIC